MTQTLFIESCPQGVERAVSDNGRTWTFEHREAFATTQRETVLKKDMSPAEVRDWLIGAHADVCDCTIRDAYLVSRAE